MNPRTPSSHTGVKHKHHGREALDDIEEIRKLKARYFRSLDSKDWDLYGSLFASDVVVDLRRAGGQL
ncbi:MAG: nuclear transport factor 2 family protein, partial [Novosphingobium sp.]